MLLKTTSQYSKFQKTSLKETHHRSISSGLKNPNESSSKRKKRKNLQKRSSSTIFDLNPLKGHKVQKAPKLYKNQIFSDIYDEKGNHDRIVDISSENPFINYEILLSELLLLPSMGRNSQNARKILFN
jgi:hypothetical protein